MKLSVSQLQILLSAVELEKQNKGIYPEGGPQYRAFQSLQRLGLIRFESWSFANDGRRFPVYRLTPSGKRALEAAPGEEVARQERTTDRAPEYDQTSQDQLSEIMTPERALQEIARLARAAQRAVHEARAVVHGVAEGTKRTRSGTMQAVPSGQAVIPESTTIDKEGKPVVSKKEKTG